MTPGKMRKRPASTVRALSTNAAIGELAGRERRAQPRHEGEARFLEERDARHRGEHHPAQHPPAVRLRQAREHEDFQQGETQ